MSRRLVITADDLGREEATTDTIAALLADGYVTATTLITVSPASPSAAARVRELGVVPHLHITLTSEHGLAPWRSLSGPSSLVDAQGRLDGSAEAVAARAETTDVLREMDAQLAWMYTHHLPPAAADSHAGVLYGLSGQGGAWLAAALRWCARHTLAFRLPRDPTLWWGAALPPSLAAAHEQALALADALAVPLPATIVTNRRSAADLGDYPALRDDMRRRLAALPEGVSELFLHPSRAEAVPGPGGVVRAWEAQLLRDPVWHRAVAAEGIELVARWWPDESAPAPGVRYAE